MLLDGNSEGKTDKIKDNEVVVILYCFWEEDELNVFKARLVDREEAVNRFLSHLDLQDWYHSQQCAWNTFCSADCISSSSPSSCDWISYGLDFNNRCRFCTQQQQHQQPPRPPRTATRRVSFNFHDFQQWNNTLNTTANDRRMLCILCTKTATHHPLHAFPVVHGVSI